jgi:hypothetical protein
LALEMLKNCRKVYQKKAKQQNNNNSCNILLRRRARDVKMVETSSGKARKRQRNGKVIIITQKLSEKDFQFSPGWRFLLPLRERFEFFCVCAHD